MINVMNKLHELFDVFHRTPCNHECGSCVLNKKFVDDEYSGNTLCDVLEDIYDVIKEDK